MSDDSNSDLKKLAYVGLGAFLTGYVFRGVISRPRKKKSKFPKNTFSLYDNGDSSLWDSLFSTFPNKYESLYNQIKVVPDDEPINVIVRTHGGGIHWCEKICNVFRERKGTVRVFILDYAHSAGSILALAADEVYMNRYATMSAIDPQVDVLGYLSYMPLAKLSGFVTSKEELAKYMEDNSNHFNALVRKKLLNPKHDIDKIMEVMYENIVDHGTLFKKSDMEELGMEIKEWDGKEFPEELMEDNEDKDEEAPDVDSDEDED